jgi:hypothetical protein
MLKQSEAGPRHPCQGLPHTAQPLIKELMPSARRCGERICERNAAQRPRWRETRRDGLDGRLIVTCRFESREATRNKDRLAHNPEVAGSNPVPATSRNGARRLLRGPFYAGWEHVWEHSQG